MKTAWIYSLHDSSNPDVPRYIGVTVDPKKRLSAHRREVVSLLNTRKINWIKSVYRAGNEVNISIIAEFPNIHIALSYEEEFIQKTLGLGFDLTNSAEGGQGGNCIPEDKKAEVDQKRAKTLSSRGTRAKMSNSRKLYLQAHPEVLQEQLDRLNNTPEAKANHKKAMTEKWQDAAYRDKVKSSRSTPEVKAKTVESLKKFYESETERAKSSEHAKRGWDSLTPKQKSDRGFKSSMTARYNRAKKNNLALIITPVAHICKETE